MNTPDAVDAVLQPYLESGLFRDANIPKVSRLYGDLVRDLSKLVREQKAEGVHLAARIIRDFNQVPFSVRAGETSVSSPPYRLVDDVCRHLLDVGNGLLAGDEEAEGA